MTWPNWHNAASRLVHSTSAAAPEWRTGGRDTTERDSPPSGERFLFVYECSRVRGWAEGQSTLSKDP